MEWALQIMRPFIKSGEYDEDFLLTYLSIGVYNEKRVPPDQLHALFEVAADKYSEGLCKLFGKPGMSIEFFSDLQIKSIYCESCN